MSVRTGPALQVALTLMSDLARRYSYSASRFAQLVWTSHTLVLMSMALLASACVFQEPPEWEPAKKTRPQLMDPVPSPLQFSSISNRQFDPNNGLDTLELFVDERSEDDGDGLRAITFINYNGNRGANSPARFQNIKEVDPGTFAVVKHLSVPWRVSGTGCTPLTLIVTHASNVDASLDHFPIDNADVASITWWFNVNDPKGAEARCPVPSLTDSSSTGSP